MPADPHAPFRAAFLTWPPFGPHRFDSAFETRWWPRIDGPLRHALDGWFDGGGGTCHVVPLEEDLHTLRGLDVEVVCFPELAACVEDGADWNDAHRHILTACELTRDRMAILDPPPDLLPPQVRDWRIGDSGIDTAYGALYYPWVRVAGPDGGLVTVPPCGHVAAAWSRARDSAGNAVLEGVLDVAVDLTGPQVDLVATVGVNPLRAMSGWGVRIWGDRTLSSDPDVSRIATVRSMLTEERLNQAEM